MNKAVRMVLYVLSLLTILGVIFAVAAVDKAKRRTAPKSGAEAVAAASEEADTSSRPKDSQRQDEADVLSVPGDSQRQEEADAPIVPGDSQRQDEADACGKPEDGVGLYTSETVDCSQETQGMDEPGEAVHTDSTANTAAEDGAETTLIFVGDVLFDVAFRAGYDKAGIDGVVTPALRQQLQDADIFMMNHEFPFSDRGTPMEDKQFTFRCSPSYVKALGELGVDIVTLANNHTLDYGREALSDTMATLEQAGIPYVGAGETKERAESLQVIEKNGVRFGFLAATRVVPVVEWKVSVKTPGLFDCYDDSRLVELVRDAKAQCDFLVVYPHWGIERSQIPEEYQTQTAARCVEAGADLIVGAHSHCLQSVEYIGDTPVFYSLGNFIFGYNIKSSAYLQVTVNAQKEVVCRLVPVSSAGGITDLCEGSSGEQILSEVGGISTTAQILPSGIVTKK